MEYLIAATLLALSALFSGLTLGLLSLDVHTLKRQANLGDVRAKRIFPLRSRGNQLLTTLLLGNVAVNAALSIFIGTIASGLVAGIVATGLIFTLGEIIPQAIISRHALNFGYRTAPFVYLIMWLFSPIAFPIAWLLDKLLGEEMPTVFSKHELMHIISEHEDSEHSPIDEDEERILHGALKFSHTKTSEVMTPIDEVIMFEQNQRLTQDFFQTITSEGYSRYPIYSGNRNNVIGIMYAKDLLIEDDDIAIHKTQDALETDFLKIRQSELLDVVLAKMLKQKRHIGVVYSKNKQCVGVISLEDIIEEIIQFEIEDEDDDDN